MNFIIYYTNDDGQIHLRSHWAPNKEPFDEFVAAIPSHQRIHYLGQTYHDNVPEELKTIDEGTGKPQYQLFIDLMTGQYQLGERIK